MCKDKNNQMLFNLFLQVTFIYVVFKVTVVIKLVYGRAVDQILHPGLLV